MNKIVFLGVLLVGSLTFAQNKPKPVETVELFFQAFHQKDSIALQNHFSKNARLLRSANQNGQPVLQENNITQFIRAVATRKDSPKWEERLGKVIVQQHLNLATVWVPFQFYLDNTISHCGYNAFTLAWNGKQWKILSLIDTATKDCK